LIRTFAILLGLLFVPLLPQQPHEGHVQDSSVKVDFTYRSEIEKISDHEYKLTQFIKNNSSSYLSVEWKDAGIACIGAHNLAPFETARKSGAIVPSPYELKSTIKYGVKLNYTAPVQMYFDPQAKSAKSTSGPGESADQRRETTFEVTNAKGSVLYSIQVISAVNDSRDSSELTFRVDGGFSFALAIDTRQNRTPEGFKSFSRPMALSQLSFRDPSIDRSIEDWIRVDDSSENPSFFLMNNPGKESIDLVGKLTGDEKFTLKKVKIIAFKPGQLGFVGLTADIFLPQDIHAR